MPFGSFKVVRPRNEDRGHSRKPTSLSCGRLAVGRGRSGLMAEEQPPADGAGGAPERIDGRVRLRFSPLRFSPLRFSPLRFSPLRFARLRFISVFLGGFVSAGRGTRKRGRTSSGPRIFPQRRLRCARRKTSARRRWAVRLTG